MYLALSCGTNISVSFMSLRKREELKEFGLDFFPIWSQLSTQQLCCQGGAQGEKLPDLVAFGDSSPSAASDLWAGKQGWPHLSFLGPFPWEGFASTWLPTHCLNSLAFHWETWALHWQFWCFLQLWWLQAVLGLIP